MSALDHDDLHEVAGSMHDVADKIVELATVGIHNSLLREQIKMHAYEINGLADYMAMHIANYISMQTEKKQ
jgi:hypothetical protein